MLELEVGEDGGVVGNFAWYSTGPRHELTGENEGRAVRFRWIRKKQQGGGDLLAGLWQERVGGWGVLVFSEEGVRGFSVEGDNALDPGDLKEYKEWMLQAVRAS